MRLRDISWTIWGALLVTMLAFGDWSLALGWLLVPVLVAAIVGVNDWCLAPLRAGQKEEEEEEELYWQHVEEILRAYNPPTMPNPAPGEELPSAEAQARAAEKRAQFRRVK
jgi:hypothetical protein